MAQPRRNLRGPLMALMPGEHSRGLGLCPACRLQKCPTCGQQAVHYIGGWAASPSGFDGEEVCENGCSRLESSGFVLGFQADMKEALYQFERRWRRRRRKH